MSGLSAQATISSPLGLLTLAEAEGAITSLTWAGGAPPPSTPILRQAAAELDAYFDDPTGAFTVPVALGPEGFRHAFLAALCRIPCGETRRYGDLAAELGVSAQAIGQACGANRVPILIPCHRVLGAGGLGGFSAPGGVETKVWLLRHEGAAGLLI